MATELENLIPETDVEVEGMRGPKGDKGDSYILTEADKEEIAQKVDKIIDAETDKTLTLSGKPADAKAAGDAIDDLKADLSEIGLVSLTDLDDYDIALADEDGNAIVGFTEGHIITKNFDSRYAVIKQIDDSYITYEGEVIDVKKHYVKAENVMSITLDSSDIPQGGACYGKYYFQMFDTRSGCVIVDLETKEITQLYRFDSSSAAWHCNNANFSNSFYDSSDSFPLLYISQENNSVRCVQVYRITGDIGNLSFNLVQTITWENPSTTTSVYYTNACVDPYLNLLIQIGYKANSYSSAENNAIKINVFDLPSVDSGDITMPDANKLFGFETDFTMYTQGAIAYNGKIYEAFGNGQSDRSLKVIDLYKQKVVSEVSLIPSAISNIVQGEQEAVFIYNGNIHFSSRTATITKLIFEEA